jgi:hypothetical protein
MSKSYKTAMLYNNPTWADINDYAKGVSLSDPASVQDMTSDAIDPVWALSQMWWGDE